MKSDKYLSVITFYVVIFALSIASGYQYIGDFIEKGINSAGMFISYFVLIALFSIYKGVSLFTRKQLLFLAVFSVLITLVSYLYPYFKYSEQNPSDLMSTFSYDLVINVIVFTLLFKEARRERSQSISEQKII
ncbi:hypothetical protein [Salinivibrio costicola]|uniref:Uncharacterized protein n=1 Tax=Salinivibrio costicola subsp. alcaliphilus TaxID=272773 RepID=A0ABX3KPL8_SALCS|nr:hypothetical protein [Salinivibrio costicola]OOF33439.1 hypothetical protein BZJ21_11040 [Salinivibrio costicola subsp. alcaliphilus]